MTLARRTCLTLFFQVVGDRFDELTTDFYLTRPSSCKLFVLFRLELIAFSDGQAEQCLEINQTGRRNPSDFSFFFLFFFEVLMAGSFCEFRTSFKNRRYIATTHRILYGKRNDRVYLSVRGVIRFDLLFLTEPIGLFFKCQTIQLVAHPAYWFSCPFLQ